MGGSGESSISSGSVAAASRVCEHGMEPILLKSKTGQNPGRHFFRCRFFKSPHLRCNYFEWADMKTKIEASNRVQLNALFEQDGEGEESQTKKMEELEVRVAKLEESQPKRKNDIKNLKANIFLLEKTIEREKCWIKLLMVILIITWIWFSCHVMLG